MPGHEHFQPRLVRGEGAPGPNVLLVDDVEANLVALEAVLSALPCRLVYARSGSQALAHLLREDFALILMDVQMPDMDGYETARLIRARRKTEHLPIIFLTAHDHGSSGIKRAYDLGAVDFLSKPLDVDVLRAKAQAFIALHERTLEVAELRAERALLDERARQEAEALRRDMARLAESDRRKTALLAALARELHAPMSSVRAALDNARRTSIDDETTALIAIADPQLKYAERIINDLSDIARVSTGAFELHPECVDVAIIVERATTEVSPAIETRGQTLIVDAPPAPIAVEVDVSQMVRVLTTLIGNAARYTPHSGHITVSWRGEYGHAVIRIRDAGVGVRPEHLDRLFDMLVPADDVDTGTLGLGLALAKQIVELHRGRINAASNGEGSGSTFEIRLLAAEFPLTAARTRRASSMKQRETARPRILRVLVVDHDEDMARRTATLLTGRGHQVQVAYRPQGALALLAEERPDVALVALNLPMINGYELVELARKIDPPLRTRFVATGDEEPDDARIRAAGFVGHLVKPLVSSDVALTLETE